MKKALALVVAFVAVATVVGCDSKPSTSASGTKPSTKM